jgi:hypothetical protein
MMTSEHSLALTRRSVLEAAALLSLGLIVPARAQSFPEVTVSKDPNCGCCTAWAEHLRGAGFPVKVADRPDMRAVKARLGVPVELASCHTAEVSGYVLEGHVPASAVLRLLKEKPEAKGLAVPGMPIGSPGMEGGEPETYDVMLFGSQPPRVFAIYRGGEALRNL